LSDDQFARIEYLRPGRPGHVGRNSDKGNRLFALEEIGRPGIGEGQSAARGELKPVSA
jgi:hypothetical protein